MRHAGIAALLCLSIGAPAAAQEAADVPPELKRRVEEMAEAFSAQDADKVAALFAPDGTIVNPMGQAATGREQVAQRLRTDFQGPLKGTKHAATVERVRMITPEIAFLDVRQELRGGNPPPGAPRPWVAHIAAVARKDAAGTWSFLDVRPHFWLERRGERGGGTKKP
jgi:uncharacterized protein (TIGR02246 family)